MATTPIEVGMFFASFNALKTEIENWSIADKFYYRIPVKDHKCVDYRCRSQADGCSWRVFATANSNGIQVIKLGSEHICIAAAATNWKTANSQTWLRRVILQHLWVTKDTTLKQIVETCAIHYNETVKYEAARLCKQFLIQDRLDNQIEQFQKIPEYISLLRTSNPLVYTDLATDPSNQCFQRIFICPHQSQTSFIQCRKFTAVDGTFLKARFVQTLLLAVGIDANRHNILLAWAIVESESGASWEYFFQHLKRAIPQILSSTMLSDRGKGILSADWVLGPGVARGHCCVHLKENFRKKFSNPALLPFFWTIANAKTPIAYSESLVQLRKHNQAAAEYLGGIDPKAWVTAFFPGKNYGHKSSNIVESMNSSLVRDRELSILDLLNEIWYDTMKTRFTHLQTATALFTHLQTATAHLSQPYTPYCLAKLLESKKLAGGNTVRSSSTTEAEVQSRSSKTVYLVNLASKTCSCSLYQENEIPCQHALQFIYSLQADPRQFLPQILSATTWRNTYLENWKPISLEDIPESTTDDSLSTCTAPSKQRTSVGRPKIARMRHGQQVKKTLSASRWHCRKCGLPGHNSATCKALDS